MIGRMYDAVVWRISFVKRYLRQLLTDDEIVAIMMYTNDITRVWEEGIDDVLREASAAAGWSDFEA